MDITKYVNPTEDTAKALIILAGIVIFNFVVLQQQIDKKIMTGIIIMIVLSFLAPVVAVPALAIIALGVVLKNSTTVVSKIRGLF